MIRLAHYLRRLANGTIVARPEIQFERRAPSLGLVDGGDGLGHVVAYEASTRAMELAEESGSGAVLIRNSSHFGMAGFYVLRFVSEGYAGMAMTDTDAFQIPFGSRAPFFGTNPICFGFPSPGIPVLLDMATTSIPYGKIALAQIEGKPIPAEWGFDANGKPTTDPHAIAGMHPIAGPKGSGLAMIIDIFSSVLSGMPWGPHINAMYEAVIEADRRGVKARSGHGYGMAQAYNHMIMPLASKRDKVTQVWWGIRDFEHRFQRRPEGMWLPETAVCLDTLEALAAHGIEPVQACGPTFDSEALLERIGADLAPGAAIILTAPGGRDALRRGLDLTHERVDAPRLPPFRACGCCKP